MCAVQHRRYPRPSDLLLRLEAEFPQGGDDQRRRSMLLVAEFWMRMNVTARCNHEVTHRTHLLTHRRQQLRVHAAADRTAIRRGSIGGLGRWNSSALPDTSTGMTQPPQQVRRAVTLSAASFAILGGCMTLPG